MRVAYVETREPLAWLRLWSDASLDDGISSSRREADELCRC